MAWPLIPIALAGIGGGLAGGFISNVFGGASKKEQSVSETHAAYEHYAPITTDARSTSRAYSPSVIYQIESPGAYISKKDTTTAESASDPTIRQERSETGGPSAGITEGTDLTKIALIGAGGLIVYGVVKEVL